MEKYLRKTEIYLHDMINDLRKADKFTIHVTAKINFMSSNDGDQKRLIHS